MWVLNPFFTVFIIFMTIIARAVVSRDTIFQSLSLEGLKSRLATFKSRKMGMSQLYLLFLWNYISDPNMPKESYSRLPFVRLLILQLRRIIAVNPQMNILMSL